MEARTKTAKRDVEIVDFGISDAKDFLCQVAMSDLRDMQESGSPRSLVHAAQSAWALVEWVADDEVRDKAGPVDKQKPATEKNELVKKPTDSREEIGLETASDGIGSPTVHWRFGR